MASVAVCIAEAKLSEENIESWLGVREEPTLPSLEDRVGRGSSPPLALVVEDNRDSRDLYVEWLTSLGCRVLAAENGLEGLRLARVCHPDFIVSDISMPVMDGCEMARRVRLHAATCKIPIIAVTGFGHGWHDAAREAGCDVVLDKPTQPDEFEAAVQALAGVRGPGGASQRGA